MRKLNLRSFFAGLLSGAFLAGAIATCILPALALVVPGNFAPRQFPTQQVHYTRFTVNFNSCVYHAPPGWGGAPAVPGARNPNGA
jgi:hypothetical protein